MQQDIFNTEPSAGKSFIYRSSAGSGKTFTLAKTFLKLVLLDPSRYNKILAITFTNKAKDEMKSRIIAYLSSLAAGEESDMRSAILEDFKKEGVELIEDVVTPRAALVLSKLLHDYSRFHVSTIDHFFTRLIRHLAKELKLNLGYELDVDSTTALAESVDLLFRTADSKLLEWLNDFALEQIDNEKSWDVRQNITELGKKLFQESYLDIADSIRQNANALPGFISANKKIIQEFRKKLKEVALQGVQAARDKGLTTADFSRGMPLNYMEKVISGEQDLAKPPSDTFLNASTLESWHTKTCKRVDDIAEAREAGMTEAHRKIVDMYTGIDFRQYLDAVSILRFIHSYGVLSSLSKCVQQYRSEQNIMFISDSAFVLHDAITESETPFIFEKTGSEIDYILIDEFQDTSTYQWKSLLPFFKTVIADGGQVYVVGDVKQSIYGWRGGDLNLLLHQVEDDLGTSDDNIISLTRNYRSAKNIVLFNNSFFTVASAIVPEIHDLEHYAPEFKLAYHDVEQQVSKKYDGLVEITFLQDSKEDRWMDQSNELTKKRILAAMEDGFSRNDILILTRTTAQARQIANYLLAEDIPAISESALRVTSSAKVQLVISALKYLESRQNMIAVAEFNHFYALTRNITAIPGAQVPQELIDIEYLGARPVYEVVEELILALGLSNKADIYLLKLLDLVLNQVNRGNSTIPAFLEWWTEQEERNSQEFSLSIPEAEDAVMILTVHKAKGLEKPIVIIPYADDEMRPKSDVYWAKPLPENYKTWGSLPLYFSQALLQTDFVDAYQKHYFDTLLESLNLLYVAFTRAGERLYINSKSSGDDKKSGQLINKVLTNDIFAFKASFDQGSEHFIIGEEQAKKSSKSQEDITSEVKSFQSYPTAENLIIDNRQTELFLAIAGEKSAKVREGLILHQILSLLGNFNDLELVVEQLSNKGLIDKIDTDSLISKVTLLFNNIPELKHWFSNEYEAINERQIFFRKSTYIPDRVMIKANEVIIVDYKREVQDIRHHEQVRKYRDLLQAMGYKDISMYLVYIDDQELVKVDD